MYSNIKLGIGIPSNGQIYLKTATCILAACRVKNFDGQLTVLTQESCYVHFNREEIFEAAIKKGCTHLWFVDTDMIFAPTSLWRLLEQDKPIIGARYNLRQLEQTHSTVKRIGGDGTLSDVFLDEMPPRPFKEIHGDAITVPTGFMLINIEALKRIDAPYFECIRPIGEDIYFCKKAYYSGVEVWCDPTIEVGHIGTCIF